MNRDVRNRKGKKVKAEIILGDFSRGDQPVIGVQGNSFYVWTAQGASGNRKEFGPLTPTELRDRVDVSDFNPGSP